MKKQILGVTMSLAIVSITSVASSSSDDNDSKSSHLSSKKKSRTPNINKDSSKKKKASSHKSKQASEDSEDNNVKHDKQKPKGQKTGKVASSVFVAKGQKTDKATSSIFAIRSSTEESSTYSLPTTDSPANTTTTPSGEEILAPKLKVVKKNKTSRTPKHAAAFEKQTGHRSATTYIKDEDIDIDAPQIGHAQGYQNHGSIADTRKNNLAVISQTTNLKMNMADRKYQNGDMDANRFVIIKDTQIAKYAIQQQANPSNSNLLVTPAIVFPADMEKLSKEENAELKKKIARAASPERKNDIARAQKKNPENFSTTDENDKKVQKKLKEYEAEGKSGPHVIKFSDQSRSNRNKDDKKRKDKKAK